MRYTLIETADDIQWLKSVHLKDIILPTKYVGFQFAVLRGNEDGPETIHLYLDPDPRFDADYYEIVFVHNPPIFAECQEINGKKKCPTYTIKESEIVPGNFRVVNNVTGDESSLYSYKQCSDIIELALNQALKGSFNIEKE